MVVVIGAMGFGVITTVGGGLAAPVWPWSGSRTAVAPRLRYWR